MSTAASTHTAAIDPCAQSAIPSASSTAPVVTPPSFRELTPEILAALLNLKSAVGGSGLPVAAWAEKLLRYCEIYQPTLRRRSLDKWGSPSAAAQQMGELLRFFFAHYEATRDLRFLNIVLKLADARWMNIPEALRTKLEAAVDALPRS